MRASILVKFKMRDGGIYFLFLFMILNNLIYKIYKLILNIN